MASGVPAQLIGDIVWEKESMSHRGSKRTLRGWWNLSGEPHNFKDVGMTVNQEPKDSGTRKGLNFDSQHLPKRPGADH